MKTILLLLSAGGVAAGGASVQAQSFSLDDIGVGGISFGAEDEFGLAPGIALVPSPSVFGLLGGDGTMVSPAMGGLQHVPLGTSIDAFSTNHFHPAVLNQPTVTLDFSIDRASSGLPGSASLVESGFGQQAGDIYTTTASFINPIVFVGGLGPGPFAGVLPSAGVGGSNVLTIDESAFGLTTIAGVVPPGVPAGPIFPGTHDNVDAYDARTQVPDPASPPPFGVYTTHSYFAIDPDAAALGGTSAANIFDTAALAPGTLAVPYAPAVFMGLDSFGHNSDSIDALVVFDGGAPGGPINAGPGAEPALDFALFSLSPGSASLAALGLSGADIFFTDFTGTFAIYALDTDLGLAPGAPALPHQTQSNVDALTVIPEPASLALLSLGLVALGRRRRA